VAVADLVGVAVADCVGGTGVNDGDGVSGHCDWLKVAVGVGDDVGGNGVGRGSVDDARGKAAIVAGGVRIETGVEVLASPAFSSEEKVLAEISDGSSAADCSVRLVSSGRLIP